MNEEQREDGFDPAAWIVKKDRGLSEREAAAYEEAIEGDPGLAQDDAEYQETWNILDRFPQELAAEIDGYSAAKPFWRRIHWQVTGMAAALALGALLFAAFRSGGLGYGAQEIIAGATPITHRLSDGSIVRINADSSIEVAFSGSSREVRLQSGEAHFSVVKDESRPFVVKADEFLVTAVGTAFNVRLDVATLEVLVTEGIVKLDSPLERPGESIDATRIDGVNSVLGSSRQVFAGQRVLAAHVSGSGYSTLEVSDVAAETIESALSWQSELRTLGGETLASISAEFERKTGRKLIISDASIGGKRIGGRFPSDNPTAFLQVLENNYGIPWRELPNGDFIVGESE